MIEVEIKLPIDNKENVEADLKRLGFIKSSLVCEEDIYFDNDAGQIRKNGEALRVRKVTDLLANQTDVVITYKGKKMDQISMSRKELETGVADAEICTQIFESLGFRVILPKVKKTRQEYTFDQMTACIDQVQDLGDFFELEMVITEDKNKDDALGQIEKMLQRLGYSLKDTTRNSYLSMLQHVEDE
ncbi:hypothetical protein BHF70_07060 [Anaerostipes sp. 494a]|uniref:class IV adenylate cyclase n=1 Tax=Anaerostipes sp. 494a TaxID=1261636 RepID=UPI0009510B68|nr:class IV adenylate cyclase [Anaerostipes sp. 494a]OLR59400.1 hypothetical protein BHF70_07060 [Anaerostipes sp. 494a]